MQVKPPPVPPEVLVQNISDILSGNSPELNKYLEKGDQQGASTTLLCVGSLMNVKNEEAEGVNSTAESRESFRVKMTQVSTYPDCFREN